MKEIEDDIPLGEGSLVVRDFERLYSLLRSLIVGQDSSFYDRFEILLWLARWTGAPPTLKEISRQMARDTDQLSPHVLRLRSGGWLTNEDRTYSLTTSGRLLIFVLRLIAQPWQDADSVAVITQLYQAASSEELGLGPEQFFEEVVTAIEASLRRLRRAVSAERTSLIGQYHEESTRNRQMAGMALTLRQQTSTDQDVDLVSRMHHALSELSVLSGQLEQHHLTLLERDLLSSGQVTLGDIQTWVAQTDEFEQVALIAPHVQETIPQPWHIPEGHLVAADADISGRPKALAYGKVPSPQRFRSIEDQEHIFDSYQQRLALLQGQLRQRIKLAPAGIPLAEWVKSPHWREALEHFIAVLDPLLAQGDEPVYLSINPRGPLLTLEQGAVLHVSNGTLSAKEENDVF